jgi:hypothetical protein
LVGAGHQVCAVSEGHRLDMVLPGHGRQPHTLKGS